MIAHIVINLIVMIAITESNPRASCIDPGTYFVMIFGYLVLRLQL